MEQFQKNEISYSQYFIAFLDVLGFKNMVFSKSKSQIEEYFGLVKHVTSKLEGIKAKQELKSIIISDSVILSIPYGNDIFERVSNLRHLCVAIGKIQYILAKKNIWLRGAISSGESYFNHFENLVVGPAYVNAFSLEENLAIYPRVIIDNKIINDIEKNNSQDVIDELNETQFSNWNSDILFNWEEKKQEKIPLNQDVSLFIDYLSPLFCDFREAKSVINNIGKNLYSNNSIYPKYRWVVDYLISHCEVLLTRLSGDKLKQLKEQYRILKRY